MNTFIEHLQEELSFSHFKLYSGDVDFVWIMSYNVYIMSLSSSWCWTAYKELNWCNHSLHSAETDDCCRKLKYSTSIYTSDRESWGPELLFPSHISLSLCSSTQTNKCLHMHAHTETRASLLLSNCKIQALKSEREGRKRVHKCCNLLLFVWLSSWSHRSSHCTICGSARTCDFFFSSIDQSALVRRDGPTSSLGYLGDWHWASCSVSRWRISDGLASTPIPPPPSGCREIWKRGETKRTQKSRNTECLQCFTFTLLLPPYWKHECWDAGRRWLKGKERKDSWRSTGLLVSEALTYHFSQSVLA